jgi:hypothetical protein
MRQMHDWHHDRGMSLDHIVNHLNRVLAIKNRWATSRKCNGEWRKSTVYNWIVYEMIRRAREDAESTNDRVVAVEATAAFVDSNHVEGEE